MVLSFMSIREITLYFLSIIKTWNIEIFLFYYFFYLNFAVFAGGVCMNACSCMCFCLYGSTCALKKECVLLYIYL